MYRRAQLKNGLKIVAKPMSGVQSVSLGIWINIGSRYEPAGQKGVSHFLEHLLFKGSAKFSCRSIKESIEGVGGSLNGFTSEEHTCYLVKMPRKYMAMALEILADMVKNPLLNSSDIAKERTVVLEELKMYRDLPQSYVNELLDELLWPAHPLGMPVIGTVETLNGLNRDNVKSFQSGRYTASNMVVSAAGNLDFNKLVKAVGANFKGLKASAPNVYEPVKPGQSKPQLKIFNKETEQTHMALGFAGLKRDHPERHAQAILHTVLGANMSSRLFNEVREKRGLAYEIGTSLKRFHDTGAFLVHAGIDNRRVPECLELIFKELARTAKSLIGDGEFRRAKEFCLGQLGLALEDTMEYMLWMGESVASLDKVYSLEQVIKEVNRVRITEVRELAGKIFKTEGINLALIGPLGGREKELYAKLNLS